MRPGPTFPWPAPAAGLFDGTVGTVSVLPI